ncbi:MAG: type IV pilus assembly protein PilM [Armatimonadota bacterium]|nr:type IV pilus assembly protein PilM [Armatimonadota bacterium]
MARKSKPSAMVGLDIGTDSIKVVEAKRIKDTLTITGLGVARLPEGVIENDIVVDPKALGNAIKALLAEAGIKTKQVTSAIAGQSCLVVRVIEVPKMSPSELAETMKWELERQVPWSPDEVIMDYQVIERPSADPGAKNADVLLAVARLDAVNSHVQALLAAGLKPVAIDIQPLAAGRALIDISTNGAKDQIVAIVDIGATDTELAIFEQGILTYPNPQVPIAGLSCTQEIAEVLGQTLEQAETLKKEYASVKLDALSAPELPDTSASAAVQTEDRTTAFDTAFGPGVVSAFDLEEGIQTPGSGAEPVQGVGIPAPEFQDTTEGPVFESPDLAIGVPIEPGAAEVPAGPSFDLGEDESAVPAFDLTEESETEPPITPVFDLEEEEPEPTQEAPQEPETSAQEPASPESIEDRVFSAISGVLVDLATELRRSIEYYSTRYGKMPERVLLCGGTAKMPHLDEFLSRELGIPVEIADPWKNLQVSVASVSAQYLKEISPMFPVAVGLAIRDMIG